MAEWEVANTIIPRLGSEASLPEPGRLFGAVGHAIGPAAVGLPGLVLLSLPLKAVRTVERGSESRSPARCGRPIP